MPRFIQAPLDVLESTAIASPNPLVERTGARVARHSAAHRNVRQIVMTSSTLPMRATDNKVSVLKARQSSQRRQCFMRDHSRPGLLILRSAVIVSVALGMLAAAPLPAASQQPQ